MSVTLILLQCWKTSSPAHSMSFVAVDQFFCTTVAKENIKTLMSFVFYHSDTVLFHFFLIFEYGAVYLPAMCCEHFDSVFCLCCDQHITLSRFCC